MKHNYSARYNNVRLRPLKKDDIELLRVWRNDIKTTRFLRKLDYITPEMQLNWYNNYLENNQEIVFAIEEINELHRIVGSVSLYDIHDGTAEIGRIQIGDPEAHGKGIGRFALVIAMYIGFKEINLNKIIGEVHQENIAAHKNDMKIGFRIVGEKLSHVGGYEDEIEMRYEDLKGKNDYIDNIIIE